MIKNFKMGDTIYDNFEYSSVDEEGNITYNATEDLTEFKLLAIDTLNWKTGDAVKSSIGNSNVNLSASNSKALVLLTKLIGTLNPDVSNLSKKEKASYKALKQLSDVGYADSDLLKGTLNSILFNIDKANTIGGKIMRAKSIKRVIELLNEF